MHRWRLDNWTTWPQPVVVLIELLLEKDPGRRFQNPAEFLKAIPTITGAIDARRRITRQSFQKNSPVDSRVVTRKPPARLRPKKISVARLPITGSDVFGRDEDIAFLDDAWANEQVNVVAIVAWAGVGKSTLVNHWLRRMATDHYLSRRGRPVRAKYRLEAYATLQHHVVDVGTRHAAHRQNAFDTLLEGVDGPLRQVM